MKGIHIILILIVTVLSTNASAQVDEEKHFNTWWSVKVKTDLSDRFYVNSQISLRRYDFLKYWQKVIIRGRAMYKVNELIVAGLGYTYSRNFEHAQPERYVSIPRSDIFSEFGFTNKFDKLRLINRFRLEHRFKGVMVLPEDTTKDAYIDGSEFSNRLRYRITFKYPIKEVNGKAKIYAAGFYELFLSMSNKFQIENINGNVFKLVTGYKFTDLTTLEVGYRRQIKLRKTYTLKEINSVLDIALKYRLDFREVMEEKLLRSLNEVF